MTEAYETLLFEAKDDIAWITLNRPGRRNALSQTMYAEFIDVARRIETDETIKVAAITGAGTVFCAGGDIKGMQDRLTEPTSYDSRRWRYADVTTRVVQTLFSLSKPLVAVLNGPAVGGGACLALLADVRIAVPSAWFSFPFLARALLPDWGATYLLPRAVGPSLALDLFLTQRRLTAEDARQFGMLSEIVPEEQLRPRADEMLRFIADTPQHPVRALKQSLRAAELGALLAAMSNEGAQQSRLTADPAFAEAVNAFLAPRG